MDSNSGGVRRVACAVLEALVSRASDTDWAFVTTGLKKPDLPEPFHSCPSVRHVHIRIPNKLWSALAMLGLVSLDRAALYFSRSPAPHLSPSPFAFNTVILPNLGFTGRLRTPYALILHDCSFLIEPRWFPLKMRLWHAAVRPRRLVREAARLFAVSETTARDTVALFDIPRERIEVFHPGIPKLRTQGAGSGTQGRSNFFPTPYLLAFGESDPRKNISTVIAAVEDLRHDPKFENLNAVILGKSSNPAPAPFIFRIPSVSDGDLNTLYQHASAVLYPSWYEGFGLPLHEAARFGTPCIASTFGALPETAPPGTVFVPPAKPHLLASAIRDVLSAPEKFRTRFDESLETPDVSGIETWMRAS